MNNSSGQTIIEVLIALSLIILFLSGVIVIELVALKNATHSQNVSRATQLARQQLERARVVRDMNGINALDMCKVQECYINPSLTPEMITPTGIGQSLQISNPQPNVSDCPTPDPSLIPVPVNYRVDAKANWMPEASITPLPEVEMSTCLTDWR